MTDSESLESDSKPHEETRRDFLLISTVSVGAIGAGLAAWPFIDLMNPSKDVLALASTEIDLSGIEEGQSITAMWRGKPVFIRRRTNREINEAQTVKLSDLKDPETDDQRVKKGKSQWLVMVGMGAFRWGISQDKQEANIMVGFALAMDPIMILLGELERAQHPKIFLYHPINSYPITLY